MEPFVTTVLAILGSGGTLYGVVAGGRATFKSAKSTEAKTTVEIMQTIMAELRTDLDRTKDDVEELRSELDKERQHSHRQDRELSMLRGMITAWSQWYSYLSSGWEHLRQKDTPPDAPTQLSNGLHHNKGESHE